MARRLYSVNLEGENIEQNPKPNHNSISEGSGGGGGNMLEARVAKLEADVENIKINLSEARSDIRGLVNTSSATKTDVSTILQKLVDIDDKISGKAGKDFVDSQVSALKVWMLGILLLSIAMPVITLLINLYMKKT